jgi:hypothetical protein
VNEIFGTLSRQRMLTACRIAGAVGCVVMNYEETHHNSMAWPIILIYPFPSGPMQPRLGAYTTSHHEFILDNLQLGTLSEQDKLLA